MMDHLCKQNDKWNWTCRCCYARTGHDERNNHSHTMNGGQLRPILCLSRLKLQRGINFHQPASFQLRNVCVCVDLIQFFRVLFSCLFSEVKFSCWWLKFDCNFPHSQSTNVNSLVLCVLAVLSRCVFFCFNVVAIPLFFLLQVQMLSKKKLLKF